MKKRKREKKKTERKMNCLYGGLEVAQTGEYQAMKALMAKGVIDHGGALAVAANEGHADIAELIIQDSLAKIVQYPKTDSRYYCARITEHDYDYAMRLASQNIPMQTTEHDYDMILALHYNRMKVKRVLEQFRDQLSKFF